MLEKQLKLQAKYWIPPNFGIGTLLEIGRTLKFRDSEGFVLWVRPHHVRYEMTTEDLFDYWAEYRRACKLDTPDY